MRRFLLGRLLEIVPTLFLVATLTFFMLRLAPGGPFSGAGQRTIPPEVLKNIERHYGLDQPLWKQYLVQMEHLAKGDLGPSYKYPTRTVGELIGQAFPVSAELGLWGLAVALFLGIPVGILSAARSGTFSDWGPMSAALLGICLPSFVLGPLLIVVFAMGLGWFAPLGWFGWQDRVLPALTLGIGGAAVLARMTRSGMLEVLSQDFIRTARAKGVSEVRIVLGHALRSGLTPVLSFMGPLIADVLTGSFIVEMIFQIPGLGRFFVNAAFNRDYTMVLGTVLFYALLLLLMNVVFDLVLRLLNPRLRHD